MLEFWSSPFSDSSFLFTDSVKHLQIPVGSSRFCPWLFPNSLLSQLGKQVWAKPVCFIQIFWGVLQNHGIEISNQGRGRLKTPTSETSYYSSVSIELDLDRAPASLTEEPWWWLVVEVFSFLFKISLISFSGGWYGTKALQGLLRDDLTAFTYLRKRNSGSDFSGLNCSRSLWSNIWRTSLSSPENKL